MTNKYKIAPSDLDAFRWAVNRISELIKIPVGGRTNAEELEIAALILLATAMLDLSGCWHPDDMLRAVAPMEVAQLERMYKDEGF